MSEIKEMFTVNLLGVPVEMKCPKTFADRLHLAAEKLNERLKSVKQGNAKLSRDKIFAATALNLMHEFIELEQSFYHMDQKLSDQVDEILKKVDSESCSIE